MNFTLEQAIEKFPQINYWRNEFLKANTTAAPEFISHEVADIHDWSEWVNPNNDSYMMKCCDCGLVHEMQFKVAKYSEGDECEFVNDPDLQPVFRARRAEEVWQEKDTAHRAGGLPQPADELTIAYMSGLYDGKKMAKREWVGLTDEEMDEAMEFWSDSSRSAYGGAHAADEEYVNMVSTWRYIEAKLKEKNT